MKVLVSPEFLSTAHGRITCGICHGGDLASMNKVAAHKGMDTFPSINNPQNTCGSCKDPKAEGHREISASAKDSLHSSLSVFPEVLKNRATMEKWGTIEEARKGHCAACHTSCGGCHVSRPKSAQKGFIDGHVFKKTPDPVNQCTACHGSRVGFEFSGRRGRGDIHASSKEAMTCTSCHKAEEMHAAPTKDLSGRYHLQEAARCEDCHKDMEKKAVRDHADHVGKVQCQVCHSQTYVNCYSCHVGRDSNNSAYFQNRREVETMKIGLNYDDKAPGAGYRYMLVRHVPSYPEMFDFYGKDLFTNFGNVPTWKRASPHNIQRLTWQAASCNHCHGNRELFLSSTDLLDYEKEANSRVIVPDANVPKPLADSKNLAIDTTGVITGMVVNARWLHDAIGQDNVVIIDARSRSDYDRGHIEGSIWLDPLTSGLRTGPRSQKPFTLEDHTKVAEIFGSRGIADDDHIVVYDKNGIMAAGLLSVLLWAGATDVSYLNGGIEGWHEAGFHTSTSPVVRQARSFSAAARHELVVGSESLAEILKKGDAVLIDSRAIDRARGATKHALAGRSGAIPGSVNIPLGAFYMDNGFLKSPEKLLWMLSTYGITPDKTVITTCDTGIAAADTFYILRYLGFADVRVHGEAWVIWSNIMETELLQCGPGIF